MASKAKSIVERIEEMEESLGYGYESLGEHECQYKSECAMFGDAGPGQWLTIQEIRKSLAKEEAALAKLLATPEGIKFSEAREAKRKAESDAFEAEFFKAHYTDVSSFPEHDDECPF